MRTTPVFSSPGSTTPTASTLVDLPAGLDSLENALAMFLNFDSVLSLQITILEMVLIKGVKSGVRRVIIER